MCIFYLIIKHNSLLINFPISIDLISAEQIAGVDLVRNIIENSVVAVGNDGIRTFLEFLDVIDHQRAEEGRSVLQRRFVDNDSCALRLDALHHALNGALTEVITVGFHRQAVHANGQRTFLIGIPHGIGGIISRALQHAVGNEILAGAVGFHNRLHHILRHVLIIGEKLLGVFRQAISAIAEGGIVVMSTNARVKTNALDDRLCIQPLHLGIGVKFIEV